MLRVGTSGDYEPFSSLRTGPEGEVREGFDVALARAFAADRGLRIEWVPFRWPALLADLGAGRFDLAMSGVTVRPERSAVARFSTPVAEAGAVLLVGVDSEAKEAEDLDRPGVRIAVNAGGHLERVARAHFAKAQVLAIPDNASVPRAFREGRADAVVTDTLEASRWQGTDLRPLPSFTRDRKAALLRPDRPELAADLDAWLRDREGDGRLAALRQEHLGPGQPATAAPLPALLAAIDERLSLMPFVADEKRRRRLAIRNLEVEARVVRRALEGVRAAEASLALADAPPLSDEAVERLFRALIDAAVAVQERVYADRPDPTRRPLSLEDAIRPALLRIGDRIATLVVLLPSQEPEVVREAVRRHLRAVALEPPEISSIAEAIAGLRASESANE